MEKTYKKNDIVELEIERAGINGEGVAHLDNGMTVFVPMAIEGERVRAKIILIKKSFCVAKLEEVLVPSQDRIEPFCEVYSRCGGCQLQHINYQKQLKIKTDLVKETLLKIGKIDTEVNDCIPSKSICGYRNKIQLPVAWENNVNKIGFFRENTHDVIDIKSCPLHEEWARKMIEVIRKFLNLTGVKGYNEQHQKGILRHVVARFLDGKIMICAVINARTLPSVDVLIRLLKEAFPGGWGLYTSVNMRDTNVIMGDKPVFVAGNKNLESEISGIKFGVRMDSFLQVNTFIAQEIYNQVFEIVSKEPPDILIDAYSGIGILTAKLSSLAKLAIGIEIVSQATVDADEVMLKNGINNVINVTADCGEMLPKILAAAKNENLLNYSKQELLNLFQKQSENFEANFNKSASKEINNITVILDPARKGCDQRVLDALNNYPVNNIIYVSCNPATLSRDVSILSQQYSISLVQPYDMFPQTSHVECVVLMQNVKNK